MAPFDGLEFSFYVYTFIIYLGTSIYWDCSSSHFFVSPSCLRITGSKGTIRHHGTFERYTRALGILIIMIPGVRYTTDPFARSRHHSTFSYHLFSGFLCLPRPHLVLSVLFFFHIARTRVCEYGGIACTAFLYMAPSNRLWWDGGCFYRETEDLGS
ncbi:hypothetical protein LB507_004887 [Fusarium sp. FIESC RH6]|nr:hypothetical protein LB507_004887 [Fusarium sp. FIESC RH6]